MTLFDNLQKITNNSYLFYGTEENPYVVSEWIDTKIPILNAILSDGDINKGIPVGKRIMISGPTSVAKSYIQTLLVKEYLNAKPNCKLICFESEGSSVVEMSENLGIDNDRIAFLPVETVEQTNFQMVSILNSIHEQHLKVEKENKKIKTENNKIEKENKKREKKNEKLVKLKPYLEKEEYIMVLDSLGMLGTEKEESDTADKKTTKDMTRAGKIKALARTTVLKLALTQTTFIVVNHVYDSMDKYNPWTISGGSGLKYLTDISLILDKAKSKEDEEDDKLQTGIIIKVKVHKSRYMKENKFIKLVLSFSKGLYKYSYLAEFCDKHIFKKEGFSYILPDGQKVRMKEVRRNIGKYLSDINIAEIDKAIKADFAFGKDIQNDEFTELDKEIDKELIDSKNNSTLNGIDQKTTKSMGFLTINNMNV